MALPVQVAVAAAVKVGLGALPRLAGVAVATMPPVGGVVPLIRAAAAAAQQVRAAALLLVAERRELLYFDTPAPA